MSFDNPFNTDSSASNNDPSNNFYNFNDEDPAAEFLARERRELGDITGPTDENFFNDPFSGNAPSTDRQSPFKNGTQSPMFNTGGSNSPVPPSNSNPYQALSQFNEQMNEPEKIRKWKEEFNARITKKDSDEEIKRQEMREQAKKELEDFHKQRLEQLERTRSHNRSNNRPFEEDLLNNGSHENNGKVHDWEKITSLCDFNPKNNRCQKDLTRYRSVLLQLKQQPNVSK